MARWKRDTSLALLAFGRGNLEALIMDPRLRDRGEDYPRGFIAMMIRQEIDALLKRFSRADSREGFSRGAPTGVPDTAYVRLLRIRPVDRPWVQHPHRDFCIELPPGRGDKARIVRFALWQLGRRVSDTGIDPKDWLPRSDESGGLPGVSWSDAREIVLHCEGPFSAFESRWLAKSYPALTACDGVRES